MILQISNIDTDIKCYHSIMIEILAITALMAAALYTSVFFRAFTRLLSQHY